MVQKVEYIITQMHKLFRSSLQTSLQVIYNKCPSDRKSHLLSICSGIALADNKWTLSLLLGPFIDKHNSSSTTNNENIMLSPYLSYDRYGESIIFSLFVVDDELCLSINGPRRRDKVHLLSARAMPEQIDNKWLFRSEGHLL